MDLEPPGHRAGYFVEVRAVLSDLSDGKKVTTWVEMRFSACARRSSLFSDVAPVSRDGCCAGPSRVGLWDPAGPAGRELDNKAANSSSGGARCWTTKPRTRPQVELGFNSEFVIPATSRYTVLRLMVTHPKPLGAATEDGIQPRAEMRLSRQIPCCLMVFIGSAIPATMLSTCSLAMCRLWPPDRQEAD